MSEERQADDAESPGGEPEGTDAPPQLETRNIQVDGGDLPKFEPEFTLERWETEEGPVVGVRYDGPELATPAERVAFVRAAMEQHEN